jgi:hypothetical protein
MSGTSVSKGMNRCTLALVSASQGKSGLGRQLINDPEIADRLLPDEAVARQRPGEAASLWPTRTGQPGNPHEITIGELAAMILELTGPGRGLSTFQAAR